MVVLWRALHEVCGQAAGVVAAVVWSPVVGRVVTAGHGLVGLHAEVAVGMVVMGQHGHHQHQDANAQQQEGDGAFLSHTDRFWPQR